MYFPGRDEDRETGERARRSRWCAFLLSPLDSATLRKKISRRNAGLSPAIATPPPPPRLSHRHFPLSHLDIAGTAAARPPDSAPRPRRSIPPCRPSRLFRFFLRTQWSPNPSRTTLPPSRLRYPSFSSYLGGTASRNNSIFLCEYNFAFNLFSPLFPSLARSLAKIPTAVDRLSLPLSLPPRHPPPPYSSSPSPPPPSPFLVLLFLLSPSRSFFALAFVSSTANLLRHL